MADSFPLTQAGLMPDCPSVTDSETLTLPEKLNGNPPTLDRDRVVRIADMVAQGCALQYALAVEHPLLRLEHWNKVMEKRPGIAGLYRRRIGQMMLEAGKQIGESAMKALPGKAWLLERMFKDEYGTKPNGPSVQVNVQTIVGVPDRVLQRAAALVRDKHSKPGPGAHRKLKASETTVDVQSTSHTLPTG